MRRRPTRNGSRGGSMSDQDRAGLESAGPPRAARGKRRGSLIERENRRPGAADWQLTRVRLDGSGIRSPWIEGYCSRQSAAAGETVEIMVSTNPPRELVIDVYRMGFYGGAGARHMTRLGPFRGSAQPDPPVGPRRLRECRWEPAVSITVPRDWPSGVYLGRLST